MVTLVHDLLLRPHLVLAEITTNWQKELRREWQYGACICNCHRAQCFDTVTETIYTETQLLIRAKLNQTVGAAEKTSVCDIFLSRKSLREGGRSSAITQTQTPPQNHEERCQGRPPNRHLQAHTTQGGCEAAEQCVMGWLSLPNRAQLLLTPQECFLINYFEYNFFLEWSTSPTPLFFCLLK